MDTTTQPTQPIESYKLSSFYTALIIYGILILVSAWISSSTSVGALALLLGPLLFLMYIISGVFGLLKSIKMLKKRNRPIGYTVASFILLALALSFITIVVPANIGGKLGEIFIK